MPTPDDTARLAVLIRKRAQGVIELHPYLIEIALAYPRSIEELALGAGCTVHDARRALAQLQTHRLVTEDGPIQAVIDLARQMYGGI